MTLNEAITRYQTACTNAGKVPFLVDETRSKSASHECLGEPCLGIPGTPSLGWLILGNVNAPPQALAFIAEAGESSDLLLDTVHEDEV